LTGVVAVVAFEVVGTVDFGGIVAVAAVEASSR